MFKVKIASLILVGSLGIGLLPTAKANSLIASKIQTTDSVWQHHIQSWSRRDLEAIVSDYNENSLMIVNGRMYLGKDQIRSVFRNLFEIFDNGVNKIDPAIVKDRIVYITWNFTPKDREEFFGTDTFVIENGVISVQTIASPLYEKYLEGSK